MASVRRAVVVASSIALLASLTGTSSVAGADGEWTLEYDSKAKRFTATSLSASLCDRHGEGAGLTESGSACSYVPAQLGFLETFGFAGDAEGFAVRDHLDDVLVLRESRPADEMRYDATGLMWATIDATEELLGTAAQAEGAVVGGGFDTTAGPRMAMFVDLSEPPGLVGDTFLLSMNSYSDDDVANDFARPLDPSAPSGSGDINITIGWTYPDGESVRQDLTEAWSQVEQAVMPANFAAGPSADPPGAWAIIGPELFGDQFNVAVRSQPTSAAALIDRVEGSAGSFGSFAIDGSTQAYFDGFTMTEAANPPEGELRLTFFTPYAPLFKGGTASLDVLIDTQENSLDGQVLESTEDSISFTLALPTGATGFNDIRLVPSQKTKVKVTGRKKPVALKKWLEGEQLAEINVAANQMLGLSVPSRFGLDEGQEVSLGTTPS